MISNTDSTLLIYSTEHRQRAGSADDRRSSGGRQRPPGCHPAERPPLIAFQLGELNEVAAGVVQHRNGRAGHVGGRHRELGAAGLDPLVVALDVVGEKHGRGLALLKQRLLIRFGRGVAVERQLQLSAVRLLGRGHGQPAIWALPDIGLLGKAQYLRIEAQGLVLVVHVDAGHFDFHGVSPLSCSRFGSAMISNTGSTLLVYSTEHMRVKVYKGRGPRQRFQSACGMHRPMRLEAHDPSTWERMERFNAGMYVRAPACANVSAVHARGASQTGMWGGGGRYWLRAWQGPALSTIFLTGSVNSINFLF